MKPGTVGVAGGQRVAVAAGAGQAAVLYPGLTMVAISGTGTLSNPVEMR